jgi:uncharacterized protein (DUF1697 family)
MPRSSPDAPSDTVFVALLRGINVGGNRTVPMKELAAAFEAAGMRGVRTYINSGNVIFRSDVTDRPALVTALEQVIEARFGFSVAVVLCDLDDMRRIAGALPAHWANDTETKCDVMFLAPAIDSEDVLTQLLIKPEFDEVIYVPGAVLWRVARPLVTRSGMLKIVGTPLYANMTVRNCNTARKLHALMEEA